MRKLFFSDIDGTLLTRNMDIYQTVIDAARRFISSGGLLSLCTGRALHTTAPVAKALGVNAPCIIYGGAAVYDFEAGEYIYSRPCDGEIHGCVDRLYSDEPDISIQVYTQSDIYMPRKNRILEERGNRMDLAVSLSPPFEIKSEVMKVLITGAEPARLAACARFFPREKFDFAFASRHFAEITPVGASKGDTAAFLADRLGIHTSDCFAAGDGHTDLPLFRIVGTSFAPAGASEDVRSGASRVIPAVEDGGLAMAFIEACKKTT